jgi:hypothetical protein
MVVVPPRPAIDFRDPTRLPFVAPMAQDGMTVILPAVRDHWTAEDATTTQILPAVPAVQPPSVQHANPRAWHNRTHVEDNDLEPTSRGKHVLAELRALADPNEELAAAPSRIIKALGGPEPEVKNPSLRMAVRLFRAARDLRRAREAHLTQDDARLDAVDARIRAFAQRWSHDDEHWDKVDAALRAKQEASDAGQLTQAYEGDGTAAALYKVDELSRLIVQRARANAGVR